MNAARLAARAAPALRRPARRPLSVLDKLATPVTNMPNKIAEYRTPYVQGLHLHGADNPTYLKGPGDKARPPWAPPCWPSASSRSGAASTTWPTASARTTSV